MAIEATHKESTFGVGDVVRVHLLLTDKKSEEKGSRTQIFEGTVIGIGGHGAGRSFTVRRIGEAGVGIEQIFPLFSPSVEKIEVKREGKRGIRQAKLYYIRKKSKREIEKIYSRTRRRGETKKQTKVTKQKKEVKKKTK
jgi:large subunit ribosomal protein L19